jgi:hypothetical protein
MSITSKASRFAFAVSVAIAISFGVTVLSAGTASAASGGGCSGWSNSVEGVSVEACINASGISVNPDGWARGSSPSCSIVVNLLDSSYGYIDSSGTQGCSSGHHAGPSGIRLGTYHSEVCVYDGPTSAFACMVSPAVTV